MEIHSQPPQLPLQLGSLLPQDGGDPIGHLATGVSFLLDGQGSHVFFRNLGEVLNRARGVVVLLLLLHIDHPVDSAVLLTIGGLVLVSSGEIQLVGLGVDLISLRVLQSRDGPVLRLTLLSSEGDLTAELSSPADVGPLHLGLLCFLFFRLKKYVGNLKKNI